MKSSKLLTAAAAVLSVFAAGASAEEYQGVLKIHSFASRAEVSAQGRVAARSVDPYAEGASAGVPVAHASGVDRATVRTQAVAAARAGDLYGEASSHGAVSRPVSSFARRGVNGRAI
jgi:hypothetical protein